MLRRLIHQRPLHGWHLFGVPKERVQLVPIAVISSHDHLLATVEPAATANVCSDLRRDHRVHRVGLGSWLNQGFGLATAGLATASLGRRNTLHVLVKPRDGMAVGLDFCVQIDPRGLDRHAVHGFICPKGHMNVTRPAPNNLGAQRVLQLDWLHPREHIIPFQICFERRVNEVPTVKPCPSDFLQVTTQTRIAAAQTRKKDRLEKTNVSAGNSFLVYHAYM